MPDFEHEEWLANQKKGKGKREPPSSSSVHHHKPHKSPPPPEETNWLGNHTGDKDE